MSGSRARLTAEPRLCWCGSGERLRRCHGRFQRSGPGADPLLGVHPFPWAVRPEPGIPRREPSPGVPAPDYVRTGRPQVRESGDVRSQGEIEALRGACRQAAEVLRMLVDAVAPGVTTDQLDTLAYDECRRRRIYPSPLNYRGYPKSICTSVNEVICHGIPDGRRLRDGDTVNLDVTVFAEGAHGDCSTTVCVGDVNPVARRLVDTARACLRAGIESVGPGRPFSAIGRAVESIATGAGYSVVREFVGHGIGPVFHTGLQIFHHHDPGQTRPMEAGMVFTVEPMINAGTHRAHLWPDGWTAVTEDLARSAQFEDTVLVTQEGVEVLTS